MNPGCHSDDNIPEIEDNNGKTPRDIGRENAHLADLEKVMAEISESSAV